jgi:granule-bound starch synthase
VVLKIDGQDVRFFHSVKQGVHRVWVDHPWFLAKVCASGVHSGSH